ncbi:MAG: M6 family metalloprotease domain-containing protein [Nitrospirae bacterium]|nr:M6 family metalloprotease domain-containing protein [Nitrospirota bacterium]
MRALLACVLALTVGSFPGCDSAGPETQDAPSRAADQCPSPDTATSAKVTKIRARYNPAGCIIPPRPSLIDPVTRRFHSTGYLALRTLPFKPALRELLPEPSERIPRLILPFRALPDVRAPSSIRIAILRLDFNDNKRDGSVTNEDLQDTFVGTIPSGSMRDFYKEVSYGLLNISGSISGPRSIVSSTKCGGSPLYSCYACGESGLCTGEPNLVTLARDAVQEFDSTVDFSGFDADSDGFVDALFVLHPGLGAEESGSPSDLWSAMTSLPNPVSVDGVKVRDFLVVPEKSCVGPASNPCSKIGAVNIGVITHEFGHILQLPDLYDVDGGSDGIGIFDVMATGAYGADNASPHLPTHLSAWMKVILGWATPRYLGTGDCNGQLLPVEQNADVIRINANGPDDTQYFLLENRQKIGFDARLPNEGLIIYHVDETVCEKGFLDNSVQNNPAQKCVDVEEAHGGAQDLDTDADSDQGSADDFFPGSPPKVRFAKDTQPSSAPYLNAPRKDAGFRVEIDDIRLDGDLVKFCSSGLDGTTGGPCPPGTDGTGNAAPEPAGGKDGKGTEGGGSGTDPNASQANSPPPPPQCGCHSFGPAGGTLPSVLSILPLAFFALRRRLRR